MLFRSIKVVTIEESYTSKCSFLDGEAVEKQYQFVKTFLNKNRALLDEVAATLQEKHSLNNDEVKEIYKRIKY